MSSPQVTIAALPVKPIGFLDIIGHSGISDNIGVSQPDFGPAHKIDQHLQPAIYRSCALSGAVHAWNDKGNGAPGDGGWAHAAAEFDRQEQSGQKYASTLSGNTLAGATSFPVTSAVNATVNEWLVIGAGANTEILQVSPSWNGASPITTLTGAANAHSTGDPIYHACRNEGYLAKSSMVIIDTGGNDLPVLGPFNNGGTFGTTPGASRGLAPFQHSLRFTIAQMRCSVIYNDTHPSCIYSGFTQAASTSTASYPDIFNLGGGNSKSYHYSTAAGSTVSFATAPDFPGGTVCIFSFSYSSGEGSLWNITVNGTTTAGVHDNRGVNAMVQNQTGTGGITGTVYRVKNLPAGVNTIVFTIGTLSTYGIFMGWGIEAPNPPLIIVPQSYRFGPYRAGGGGYALWDGAPTKYGYARRAPQTTQTATVAASAGTAAGSVTLGTAITIGTTTQNSANVQVGDTITIGAGLSQETRRIVGIDSTTTLHVDANFLNAHTAETCQIGLQDADVVGGGYINTGDTQGKTSVPGLNSIHASVAAEFDNMVQTVNFDAIFNPPGVGVTSVDTTNVAVDGVHTNDNGAGKIANAVLKRIVNQVWPVPAIASVVVPNRRTYLGVYGDAGATPTTGQVVVFANGWSNYFPTNGNYPRTGYYKDMRTRMVYVIVCCTGGTDGTIFALPIGYLPSKITPISGFGSAGPVCLLVFPSGVIQFAYGYPGTTGFICCEGSYLAEA